jgi:hypothetical protein
MLFSRLPLDLDNHVLRMCSVDTLIVASLVCKRAYQTIRKNKTKLLTHLTKQWMRNQHKFDVEIFCRLVFEEGGLVLGTFLVGSCDNGCPLLAMFIPFNGLSTLEAFLSSSGYVDAVRMRGMSYNMREYVFRPPKPLNCVENSLPEPMTSKVEVRIMEHYDMQYNHSNFDGTTVRINNLKALVERFQYEAVTRHMRHTAATHKSQVMTVAHDDPIFHIASKRR